MNVLFTKFGESVKSSVVYAYPKMVIAASPSFEIVRADTSVVMVEPLEITIPPKSTVLGATDRKGASETSVPVKLIGKRVA